MQNKVMLEKIIEYNRKPEPFEKGNGNIWTEPHLSEQMLKCHLDLSSDASSRREEMIEQTVEFLHKHIKSNSKILDLGCGPGLYTERLCKKGHTVTGIDFSDNSILYAKKSAAEQGLEIEYQYKNIFELQNQEEYDLITQIYGEVNTFSDEDRDRIFKVIHKALKSGGQFIFDVTTPNRLTGEDANNWYSAGNGFWRKENHLVLENTYHYENHVWVRQYIVVDESEVKVYRNWFHEYTKEEIEKILIDAGFSGVQVYDNLYQEKNMEKSEWLTVIARK